MPSSPRPDSTDRTVLLWRFDESMISVIWQYPSETYTYVITVEGTNAPTSPTVVVYKNGTDVTATVMPTGSHTVSGQNITLKPLTLLTAGSDYAVIVNATIAGNTESRKLIVQCVDPKAV